MDTYCFDTTCFDASSSIVVIVLFAMALESYLSNALNVNVWAVHIPQTITATPQLVYKLEKRSSYNTLAGPSKLVNVVYSIDVVGTDKLAVDTLAEQLRGVLQSYRGAFGGLFVTGCRLGLRTYAYDPPSFGSDFGTFTYSNEYTFDYIRQ